MDLAHDYQPEFDSIKDLLLEMAQEHSIDDLLRLIVRRLAERPHVALARIWLISPTDDCGTCPPFMEKICADRSECLHLVASAGRPQSPDADWSHLGGDFQRFPIGDGIVGRIAATGEPVLNTDLVGDTQWITRPEWAESEDICGYGGQPLVYRDEVLGAMVVFLRIRPQPEGMTWMRILADHAATAIANARAFEEIERLKSQLELERDYLREEVREAHAFGDIIGRSAALQNVLQQVDLVAPTNASVLILGESGTGKELVAREIHKRSPRRERPMIRVNCASVPGELYESEFFGHVKGAFTGAVSDRAGRFELADGGTLFLDEVGEIPLALQGKLLRVLQEGEFERVGEEKTRQVDVRIIAATNRELKGEVDAGRFRQDLYYRLNVFPLEVAPLRRRPEDVPLLTSHFVQHAAARFNLPPPRLTRGNIHHLQQYSWPGNVRELRNVIERAVITSRSGVLQVEILGDGGLPGDDGAGRIVPAVADAEDSAAREVVLDAEMKQRERANLLLALNHTGWRIYGPDGAAELLGVKPTTLASRVSRLGLKRPK
ncbi:MAG: sigma 54-interacting transcriptional regulator [Candidatus Nealsonbacteria bacterium]|nr:sigma 54-interacting transcriptional regulator [Candidatus Nealsonbacteria bacterium]